MEDILQSFIENTPDVLNFFAGYFPEAEFDDTLTDKKIIANYILSNTTATITQTYKELEMLDNDPNTLKLIAREINRHFETTEEIWQWLQMIKKTYQTKIEQL
ncbi:hypothetical protein [Tenacibaculum sp. M341]|uniref:hypothetical protein n=1 Tax=Tenacibaculum sp. M341 TaxID=2530339 RepID=UPI0010487BF0|nr:hypothetical protein [Tenacibaculum sp. M341]TCI94798.1 hypothetical protein EYW44_00315 [Tenacibaculum sp. M341]